MTDPALHRSASQLKPIELLFKTSRNILLFFIAAPALANESAETSSMPGLEFMLSLGALVFLILFFGLLIWNRNQQRAAQRRTQELLSQLTESNAQTRDLQSQLNERKQTEEMLLRRGNLKRIIASLSSDFVRLGPDEIDDGINRALGVIGEFAEKARAYVFLVREDGSTIDNTHEWCSPGVSPFLDELQGISLDEDVPWFGGRIREFREVHIPSVDELPPEARLEKKLFHLQDIGSIFCVPMISGNKLRGFLGFDSLEKNRTWPDDIVQLLRIVGEIFTNALDRQRAEKTLRESENRFRELADLLPQTIFETDPNVRITYFNRQGLEITGYTEDDVLAGIDGYELFKPIDQEKLQDRLQAFLKDGLKPSNQEYTCVRKDGTTFPGMIYARPIIRDGKPSGYRGILIDMTRHKEEEEERRRLESQFLQAQKFESLSVMAGSIAHNFNNLLTVVLGNLELVISDSPKGAPWMEHLVEADRAVKRASELSTMLLTYVGKNRMNMDETDLNPLIQDMEAMLGATVSKNTNLSLQFCSEPCLLRGDAAQLRQVVVNLVNNASDAVGDRGGEITLTTGFMHYNTEDVHDAINDSMEPGDYVYVEIRDNGVGMDDATRARVFDPFFTTKFTGRGLGLAAVLGIVRAHRGGITLETEKDNGTVVRAMFPRVVREDEIVAVSLPKRKSFSGSGTVLLVDDEQMVLGVGRRMLQRLGFDVLTAADGEEAIKVFDEHCMDIRIVLLDLTMPRMDGEETFRELKKRRPNIRVVVASGYTEEQVSERFKELGPVGFIRKPFQLKDLANKLEEVLAAEA